jgi:hypothetical protein
MAPTASRRILNQFPCSSRIPRVIIPHNRQKNAHIKSSGHPLALLTWDAKSPLNHIFCCARYDPGSEITTIIFDVSLLSHLLNTLFDSKEQRHSPYEHRRLVSGRHLLVAELAGTHLSQFHPKPTFMLLSIWQANIYLDESDVVICLERIEAVMIFVNSVSKAP